MKLSRRGFLRLGILGVASVALPIGRMIGPMNELAKAGAVTSPPVEPFQVPLPIPPVLKPVRTDASTDYYEMVQREATAEILPGYRTTIWGYEGIFPGPTIEARSGRQVVVSQRNELPVPVVTHLHGGVTPPESDGYPTDLILPASSSHDANHGTGHHHGGAVAHGTRDYVYPNQQRAAMLWYHDHRMDFTGPQVYRGLAGLYIIRDEIEDALPLPRDEREVPLVITDRTFTADGDLYYPSLDPTLQGQPGVVSSFANGVFGDTILVNGAPWPVLDVGTARYRLRLLNASNARPYLLALDPPPPNGPAFIQIGSDGGLLETPIPHDEILISPAERFDVIVDFGQYPVGTSVRLVNREGVGPTADVMRFDVARREEEYSEIPDRLAPEEPLPDPSEAVEVRRFQFIAGFFGWPSTVNFRIFDPNRIAARPRLDTTEIWELHADPEHPIHLHLVHFRVLSRNGGPPGPWDAGWKDTVFMRGGSAQIIARFSGYRGKYVFHCHNLEHEDMMMMENFEVV